MPRRSYRSARSRSRRRSAGGDPRAASGGIAELHGGVRAVAEGLVLGGAAATHRHAIAHLVGVAVSGDERNATPQPQRTTDLLRRVFDEAYRNRQRMLD